MDSSDDFCHYRLSLPSPIIKPPYRIIFAPITAFSRRPIPSCVRIYPCHPSSPQTCSLPHGALPHAWTPPSPAFQHYLQASSSTCIKFMNGLTGTCPLSILAAPPWWDLKAYIHISVFCHLVPPRSLVHKQVDILCQPLPLYTQRSQVQAQVPGRFFLSTCTPPQLVKIINREMLSVTLYPTPRSQVH